MRWTDQDVADALALNPALHLARKRPASKTATIIPSKPETPSTQPQGLKATHQKRRKYRNEPIELNGERYDSKKEARRHQELIVLERAGKIRSLTRQRTFNLSVNGEKICDYRCDFEYFELRDDGVWEWIVEDVKSPASKTPVYRLKKKLVRAIWRVEIRET